MGVREEMDRQVGAMYGVSEDVQGYGEWKAMKRAGEAEWVIYTGRSGTASVGDTGVES